MVMNGMEPFSAIVARRGALFMSEPMGSGGETDGESDTSAGGARHLLKYSSETGSGRWRFRADGGSGGAAALITFWSFDRG